MKRLGPTSVLAVAVLVTFAAAWFAATRPGFAQGESFTPASVEEGILGTPDELAGWRATRDDKLVRARELGEKILRQNPDSFAGHYVLGYAQHYGETNLPRALFHLRRALTLFESQFGTRPAQLRTIPWRWHQEILLGLAWASGELDLHEERISYLKIHDQSGYKPSREAEQAWPLMKLGKLDEARAKSKKAMTGSSAWQRKVAATALCGIEFESGDREAAYRACSTAVELVKNARYEGATEFCNGGVASMAVLRFDEAERRFLEGTKRPPADYANPWRRLVSLYTREARLAEAVGAAKEIHPYRLKRPPHVDQHDQSETESTLAALLMVSGYWEEARTIADRALARPDRQGGSSTSVAQAVAGAALLARAARYEAAERLAEKASVAPIQRAVKLRLQSWNQRARAWAAGRRAATLLADEKRLVATLRPHSSGGAEGSEWLLADIVEVIGTGVAKRALALAREREPIAGAHSYLDVLEAEVSLRAGELEPAVRFAERALQKLPGAEGLLAARAAAIGADAAWRRGDLATADKLYQRAMMKGPGMLRHLGLQLPVTFLAAGDDAEEAGKILRSSPRFRSNPAGFLIKLRSGDGTASACLETHSGNSIVCAEVRPGVDPHDGGGEPKTASLGRRLAAQVHERFFAPKVDLSQADLRSLDGSPSVGNGRAALKMRDLIDEVVPPKQSPPR